MRVKREFLRRSNIGVIATRRAPAASGLETNAAYGADMNLFLFRNVTGNLYYARTDTGRAATGQASYRGRFDFTEDRWAYTFEHLLVGPQFDPGVGFVRRVDFRRNYADFQFNPRPRNSTRVRRYSFLGVFDYVTSADARVVQNKELRGQFSVQFQNGDSWTRGRRQGPVRVRAEELRHQPGNDDSAGRIQLPKRPDVGTRWASSG